MLSVDAASSGAAPQAFPETHGMYELANRLGITVAEAQQLREGDVMQRFHPSSGRPYKIIPGEVYAAGEEISFTEPDHDHPPIVGLSSDILHRGFKTRDDFELAKFMLDAGLNGPLKERLLDIIHKAQRNELDVTISSLADLDRSWEIAMLHEVPVSLLATVLVAFASTCSFRRFHSSSAMS